MPEIVRFSRSSLRIYVDDHRPPHFHIVGPDFAILVDVSNFEIISGEARAKDIAEALEWARANKMTLERIWHELNERDLS
jgi:prophage antirepressor-like protein